MVDGQSVSTIFFPSFLFEVHLPVQLFCKRRLLLACSPRAHVDFANAKSYACMIAILEDHIANSLCVGGGGSRYVVEFPQGVLPYIGYTGMCRWRGYGFQAIWSGKGYGFQAIWSGRGYGFQAIWSGIWSSNHRKLVYYRVLFDGIAHKRLKSRTIEHFWSGRGSQNLQNFV